MIGRMLLIEVLGVGMLGQAPSTPVNAAMPTPPAKAYRFDVISIRENKSPRVRLGDTLPYGPTADGYRMRNDSLADALLLAAYVPQVGGSEVFRLDQIKGLPEWLVNERYDIDARIADEDRAEWQKPAAQKKMLQAMLQAMFVERCKLAVHREMKDADVDSLEVAKGGPKFKETDPTVEHPGGSTTPWGAIMVPSKDGTTMYRASMAFLVVYVAMMGDVGRTVQDKTGLTGKYDLVMRRSVSDEQQDGVSAPDPQASMRSILNDLGLKLVREKGQVETLVIDHMEKPSEN